VGEGNLRNRKMNQRRCMERVKKCKEKGGTQGLPRPTEHQMIRNNERMLYKYLEVGGNVEEQ